MSQASIPFHRGRPGLSARSPIVIWSCALSATTGSRRSSTAVRCTSPISRTAPTAFFVATNVQGTLNLLDAAVVSGVERFVFTSTTSLMISQAIRDGFEGGARKAAWLTEAMSPEPRNIYGVTKLSAEHLCRLYHIQHGLPVVVLRTARFFPEADDMAHAIEQSDANTKANELLFRRLTVDDAAAAHILALEKAPRLGFDVFIVSAPTPFRPDDCAALIADAPSVVARYFPDFLALYARKGWTMFGSIDRVYDASRASDRLVSSAGRALPMCLRSCGRKWASPSQRVPRPAPFRPSGRHSRSPGAHRRGRAILRLFPRPCPTPDRRSGRGRSASRSCRNSP